MGVTLNYQQARLLLDAFGEAPGLYTLTETSGHSGPGLYAHHPEYPEEGSIFLGVPGEDEDSEPNRVIVALTDLPDGTVGVGVTFIPPLSKARPETGVHKVAAEVIEALAPMKLSEPGESGEVVNG